MSLFSRFSRSFRLIGRNFSSLGPREQMEYDVVVVGAGPSGLSTAIKLKQLNAEINVCVVEKASEVGEHILSGNVFDTRGLDELIPNWKELEAPIETKVTKDKFMFLTENYAIPLPIPKSIHNTDKNYVISLGQVCRWMAKQAEELGVEIYPGFAASEVLFDDNGVVKGIATSDQGLDKDGNPKDNFSRGVEIIAKQTVISEGCRGSLAESIMSKFDLRANCDPQSYAIGLKEVWEVDPKLFEPGLVLHTVGWPLPTDTYGGSFLYHMKPNFMLVGYAVGLDYKDPYLSPYSEFQRFKTHPAIKKYFVGAKCVSYGARALNEGGYQSIPKLTFPGGLLVGDSAGFLNPGRLKGSHTAMKSGILAAEAINGSLKANSSTPEIFEYETSLRKSWINDELYEFRNVHYSFKYGRYVGMLYSAFTTFITRGKEFWTFRHSKEKTDSSCTQPAANFQPKAELKPDGAVTFDLLTNLQRSGTSHGADQPSHLTVKSGLEEAPLKSFREFAGPEQRFCPAKVYEFVEDSAGKPKLQINYSNCLHCKTCAIKTPQEYINWQVPPGGQGPKYGMM